MKQIYRVSGMTCNGCRTHVEKTLSKLEGVTGASVNLKSKEAVIEMKQPMDIVSFRKALPDKYGIAERESPFEKDVTKVFKNSVSGSIGAQQVGEI